MDILTNGMKALAKRVVEDPAFVRLRNTPPIETVSTPYDVDSTEVVFVLSPGRSGTKSLVDYFIRNTDLFALHTIKPTMASIGYAYSRGEVSAEAAYWAYRTSRHEVLELAYSRRGTFFDGDCKNLPILDVLCRKFPASKVIYMYRDPYDFIQSGLGRGYFSSMPPAIWGHLTTSPAQTYPDSNILERASLIGEFWEISAQIADRLRDMLGSERFSSLKAESFFANGSVALQSLVDLNLANHITHSDHAPAKVLNRGGAAPHRDRSEVILNVIEQNCPHARLLYPDKY